MICFWEIAVTKIKNVYMDKLGFDKQPLSQITSICVSLFALFYIFYSSSILNLDVFVLENRVMYDVTIKNSFFLISETLDTIVLCVLISTFSLLIFRKGINIPVFVFICSLISYSAIFRNEGLIHWVILASFPIFLLIYFVNYFYKLNLLSSNHSVSLSYTYFSIILIILGSYSITLSTLKITGIIELNEQIKDYAYNLFVIISRMSPFIVILISFTFIFRMLVNYLRKKSWKVNNKVPRPDIIFTSKDDFNLVVNHHLILVLILLFSIVIPIIPQLPTTNPDNRYVGVDTFWYVNWTSSFNNNDPLELLNNAFSDQSHGDRPLSLFIIFGLSKILPTSPGDAIDTMPVLLSPILTLTVYFLSREFTNNRSIHLLVTFLSVLSFQVLIGIYAGFYANWLGLIVGNICLVFLLRYLKSYSWRIFGIFFTFLIMLVLVHVYTWSIYSIAIFLFAIIALRIRVIPKRIVFAIFIAIGVSVSIDVVKDLIVGSSGGVSENIKLTYEFVGINNIFILLENIYASVLISHGGIFGNGLVLVAVFVFSIFYFDPRKLPDLLMLSFLTLLILPIFFGYWNIQVRVLYDIPFQLPFGLALYYLLRITKDPFIFLAFIFLQTAVGIRTVTNFYLIES